MGMQDIAAALQRVEAVLRRRPEAGVHDDAPATALWKGGTRVIASHDSGKQVLTDMPAELGGSGDQVSPGWLLRAGFASCTATCIAMAATAEGIELLNLDVQARSRSDTRGMLGLPGSGGEPVYAGPLDVQMTVRISAHGVSAQRLRDLADRSFHTSPMARALVDAVPVSLRIEVPD